MNQKRGPILLVPLIAFSTGFASSPTSLGRRPPGEAFASSENAGSLASPETRPAALDAAESSQDQPGLRLLERVAATEDPYHEPATGLLFPRTIGTWRRGRAQQYPPGLGMSIDYDAEEGARTTIYVYDFGLRSIPPGPASVPVKEQFRQAKSEGFEAERLGRYLSVTHTGDDLARLGNSPDAPVALRASFEIRVRQGDLLSLLYITGYKNQFFKMRISYAVEKRVACEQAIESLLGHLGAMLKG